MMVPRCSHFSFAALPRFHHHNYGARCSLGGDHCNDIAIKCAVAVVTPINGRIHLRLSDLERAVCLLGMRFAWRRYQAGF
jgi:hypothetical protein